MTYARARLWIGITSVGTWVVLSAVALWIAVPDRIFAVAPSGIAGDLGGLALAVVLFAGIGFTFDLLGGFVLPRRFGRSSAGLAQWLQGWVRGVGMLGILTILLGMIVMNLARSFGTAGAVAGVAAASLLLVIVQGPLAHLVGHLPRRPGSNREYEVVENLDRGFTGGWVGWPGQERLLIPATWLEDLGSEQLEAEIRRRTLLRENGSRARGVWFGLAFNLVGFGLVSSFAGVDLTAVAGIVSAALWMTLWSFLGALLLPSLSRPAVYAADRLAREAGTDPDALVAAMQRLDQLQDDEPRRPVGVETVFHPIPALQRRIDRLEAGSSGGTDAGHAARSGAWHAARMALFFSSASFGLLGRAVHCNCGRPELWVLLPAD